MEISIADGKLRVCVGKALDLVKARNYPAWRVIQNICSFISDDPNRFPPSRPDSRARASTFAESNMDGVQRIAVKLKPHLADYSEDTVLGVILHEFGHVLNSPLPETMGEQKADAFVFGVSPEHSLRPRLIHSGHSHLTMGGGEPIR